MKNKINIAELLKDCPKGMELDCAMFENVTLCRVDNNERAIYPITVLRGDGNSMILTKYGQCSNTNSAKCVIFPKGKTTWEGFLPPCKFKDGDIVAGKNGACSYITIFREFIDNISFSHHACLTSFGKFKVNDVSDSTNLRFATEEEKQKLFDEIKDNGYNWNAETKTLEKLTVPSTPEKFYIRIGDIPSEERSSVYRGDVVVGYEDGVSVYDCVETDGLYRIVMPFPLKEGQGMTYECLIQEITQCRYEIENPRNVYLVSGIEVGKGNDNEPVIKNVKILKDLTEQFNTKNDNTEETKTLEKLEDIEDKGNISDGYHTFNELYEYRLLYNASMFNELAKQGLYDVHKSKLHSDGAIPFGDENWFIVQAELPTGQISNHYEMKDWDLFQVPIKEKANQYDGHTPQDVAKRLRDFLTLEKLPRFKIGDRIRHKEKTRWVCTITRVTDRYYVDGHPMCYTLPFGKQDDYELVSNIEPKFKVGDKIKHKDSGIYCTLREYSEGISAYRTNIGLSITCKDLEDWELVPNKFDITTLVPFESRVLVRSSMDGLWKPAVFGFRNGYNDNAFYIVGGSCWKQCIPYLNNEHLCGTTNDCDDFYKTWE